MQNKAIAPLLVHIQTITSIAFLDDTDVGYTMPQINVDLKLQIQLDIAPQHFRNIRRNLE